MKYNSNSAFLLILFAVILANSCAQKGADDLKNTVNTKAETDQKQQVQPAPGVNDQTEEVTVTMVYEYDVDDDEEGNGTESNKTVENEAKGNTVVDNQIPGQLAQPGPGPGPAIPLLATKEQNEANEQKPTVTSETGAQRSSNTKEADDRGPKVKPEDEVIKPLKLNSDHSEEKQKVIAVSAPIESIKLVENSDDSLRANNHEHANETPKLRSLTLGEIFNKPQKIQKLHNPPSPKYPPSPTLPKTNRRNGASREDLTGADRFYENGHRDGWVNEPIDVSQYPMESRPQTNPNPLLELMQIAKKLDRILKNLKSTNDNELPSKQEHQMKVGESQVEMALTRQVAPDTRLVETLVKKVPKGGSGLSRLKFDSEESKESFDQMRNSKKRQLAREIRLIKKLTKNFPKYLNSDGVSEMSDEDSAEDGDYPAKKLWKKGRNAMSDEDSGEDYDDDDQYDEIAAFKKHNRLGKRKRCGTKLAKKLRCLHKKWKRASGRGRDCE